ncbi:MAG TPA: ETC complex I subunit [Hyphomonadaceae bacterium]|nr:ETC complex I subunit [Hyphomonadaceae bacterium]
MALARIYRPAKTAMQSGKAGAKEWLLEFEPQTARRPDPLMGWTSSSDTQGQVRLAFASREDAIAFARANQIAFQISEPREPKRFPKSYGENFAFYRLEPWSH